VHKLILPSIDFENTMACINSMHPQMRLRTIVIDNTEDADHHKTLQDFNVRGEPMNNLGVAGSWNHGCRLAFAQGADFVTLCSASMRFGATPTQVGGLDLCRVADVAVDQKQWPWGFESMHGWHLFTLGRKTWETVGEFDEAFFPAYFEDNDYIWRMRVAGILEPRGDYFARGISTSDPSYGRFTGDWQHRVDGDVTCDHFEDFSVRKIPWIGSLQYELVEDAGALKSGLVTVDFGALTRYYVAKWGGTPGCETSLTPLAKDV
jgi:hypothetical protein